MSGRRFLIADTHFGHKKIVDFRRPWSTKKRFDSVEEHDEELLSRINSVCGRRDHLIILGDVYFGDGWTVLQRLNPTFSVVLGNHDKAKSLLSKGATKVVSYMEHRGGVLSHMPIHTFDIDSNRYTFNVHGHLHDKKIDDDRYLCVSADHVAGYPIEISEAIALCQNTKK